LFSLREGNGYVHEGDGKLQTCYGTRTCCGLVSDPDTANKLATNRCNGICDTTRHNRHNGLLPRQLVMCILPIFLYGSEIWCLTSTLEKKIDALDNFGLRRILHIHWTDFVSSDVVRLRTGQPLLSDTIRQRRLFFFGHLCRADIGQDHSRALRACIRGPPKDWRRRTGRPRQTWLRTVEDDLRPLNFGLATARRRAMDRPAWRLLVDAATSS